MGRARTLKLRIAEVHDQMPRKQIVMSVKTPTRSHRSQKLYQSDHYSRAVAQARALRGHRVENLDWENLAEEVEDLANRNADALESQSERLIGHLLKIVVAPSRLRDKNLRLWQLTVRDARRKISTILKKSRPESACKRTVRGGLAWRPRPSLGGHRTARRGDP